MPSKAKDYSPVSDALMRTSNDHSHLIFLSLNGLDLPTITAILTIVIARYCQIASPLLALSQEAVAEDFVEGVRRTLSDVSNMQPAGRA